MKKYTIGSLLLVFIILSCENEIPYKSENKTPKLIMNAFINADSLDNTIFLSLTGKNKVQEVEDAIIKVSINGEFKEYAQQMDYTYYPVQKPFKITTRFQPGDKVRIEASTTDGEYQAWIEETVPYPIDILKVDTNTVFNGSGISSYRYEQIRMKVLFKDRPKEKNYYRIIIGQREKIRGKIPVGNTYFEREWKDTIVYNTIVDYWPWEDVVLTDGRPATTEELDNEIFERVKNIYGVFDDSRFQDSEYTMLVRTSLYDSFYSWPIEGFVPEMMDMDVVIRLQSITESQFYYLNALNIIDSDILDEYISDPIKMPSNVNGGTGFVGISTESFYEFQAIKDKPIEYYDYTGEYDYQN